MQVQRAARNSTGLGTGGGHPTALDSLALAPSVRERAATYALFAQGPYAGAGAVHRLCGRPCASRDDVGVDRLMRPVSHLGTQRKGS